MTHLPLDVERTVRQHVHLIVALSVLTAWACHPNPSFIPGFSDASRPSEVPPSAVTTHQPAVWEHFHGLHDMQVIGTFWSRGHGTGHWQSEARVNGGTEQAMASLVRPTDSMPVGSLLVQSHSQNGTKLGYFAMKKREPGYFSEGGDWEYVVVSRDGRVESRGKIESCARCHAQAPVDYLFRLTP